MTTSVSLGDLACIVLGGLPALVSKAGADKEHKAECLGRETLAERSRYTNRD
jgi:hypothetical protein